MTVKSDFIRTIIKMTEDWKAKQNKNSFECAVQLQKELAKLGLDNLDDLCSRIEIQDRLLRDVASAFADECVLPYESVKSRTLRAVIQHIK